MCAFGWRAKAIAVRAPFCVAWKNAVLWSPFVNTASAGSTRFHRNSQMCYFWNKLGHPQRHKLARESAYLRGFRVEFQKMGERLVTLFECFLNFSGASYLDIQSMHSGRISQCYINIDGLLTLLEIHLSQKPRGAVMPAVRIKVNKPRGKIWF